MIDREGSRPDRIFFEARVLTGDPARPRAEALAVRGARIVAVGDQESVRALAGPTTEFVALGGAALLPGFHDAHTHLSAGALLAERIDLRQATSAEEAAERVAEAARSRAPGAWLRGWGWDQSRWPGGGWPDGELLDRAIPAHRVVLSRIDGHALWANRRALESVGAPAEWNEPGFPPGILLEQRAEQALARIPAEDEGTRRAALERALATLAPLGICALDDVCEPWAVRIYAALAEGGGLPARVNVWLPFEPEVAEAEEWRRTHPPGHPWLAVATRKFFLDGTLGARSAALEEAYADEPGNTGLLRVEPQRLFQDVREADAGGWALALHAIGDRALRVALEALGLLPRRSRRMPHRIEHVQVAQAVDVARFARVGALASLQPVHLLDDAHWVEARLGPRRGRASYPLRSLLRAGVPLAFGSDWPVAPLDPLQGIVAASSFRAARDLPDPSEALTVAEALAAYSAGPARACGAGSERGRIAPGFLADMLVLSEDPTAIPAREIPERVRVVATYVGGRCVFPPAV